jgi:cyanophycinase
MSRIILIFLLVITLLTPATLRAADAIIVAHGGGTIFSAGSGMRLHRAFKVAFDLGGGRSANIVTFDGSGDDTSGELAAILRQAGYRKARFVQISDPAAAALIAAADVIYFDGGIQTKLMRRIQAFPEVLAALQNARQTAKVIGGLSAGAAIMSDVMICCNRGQTAVEARGMGYLDRIVIDQHYSQREREFRLRQIIAAHPGLIGVGIDETVAVVFQDGVLKVVRSKENTLRPQQKFSGCKYFGDTYNCTCDTGMTHEGLACVKDAIQGNDANQFATVVQMVNGQIVETQLQDGESMRF